MRFELMTSSLPRKRSTPELHWRSLSGPFGHSGILPFFKELEPMEGIEPTTPRLQITCSSQLSYIGDVFNRSFPKRDCKDRY